MYSQAQQLRTDKQDRMRKVATAAVLAVALAMAGLMPAWAGGPSEHAGTTAATLVAEHATTTQPLVTAAELANLGLTTDEETGTTRAVVYCVWVRVYIPGLGWFWDCV